MADGTLPKFSDLMLYHISVGWARMPYFRIVDNFLQLNGVQRLEWPPMSPDLSCIEHLWDILGRAVNKHINQHTRLADLQRFLLQEWAAIPQRQIQRPVNSMRRRLNECRVNLGGYTHYSEKKL